MPYFSIVENWAINSFFSFLCSHLNSSSFVFKKERQDKGILTGRKGGEEREEEGCAWLHMDAHLSGCQAAGHSRGSFAADNRALNTVFLCRLVDELMVSTQPQNLDYTIYKMISRASPSRINFLTVAKYFKAGE